MIVKTRSREDAAPPKEITNLDGIRDGAACGASGTSTDKEQRESRMTPRRWHHKNTTDAAYPHLLPSCCSAILLTIEEENRVRDQVQVLETQRP